jgi:hypothetical protein
MEDMNKLPKWAKSRIKVLEQNNASLEKQIRQIEGKEETNTYIQRGIDKKINLPTDWNVHFIVNGQPIVAIFREKTLELQGHASLHILPRASNSIEIYQDRY